MSTAVRGVDRALAALGALAIFMVVVGGSLVWAAAAAPSTIDWLRPPSGIAAIVTLDLVVCLALTALWLRSDACRSQIVVLRTSERWLSK